MPAFRILRIGTAILLLAGCAARPPTTQPALTTAAPAAVNCPTWPTPKLRTDLPPGSLDGCGQPNWPPNNGFEPPKLNVIVPAGELLDRFGDTRGVYLSPEGAPYDRRALPYDCRGYNYTVYKVLKPLPALLGTAAPAFGEPGGAIQLQTAQKVQQLIDDAAYWQKSMARSLYPARRNDGERVTVRVEQVASPTAEVRLLIGELDAELLRQYPPEQRHGLALEAIFQPHIRFFIAWLNGAPVGCGGVALFADFAELKRMYVREDARGRGVADAILARLATAASDAGLPLLRLETGTRQQAAIRFYQRTGFAPCPAFPPYSTMPAANVVTSLFMERRLA